MSWREGRETPTIFSAALTIRWRDLRQDALQAPYHTVMQLECSRWCLCRRCTWWGPGLWLFLVCGGSRDAVVLSWLVLQSCWSRRGPLWCVHPGTWCCSLSPRSHHWWSEEHAESALSWSQRQSPSSSPHSERDCCHCTTRPGGSPRSCSLSHLCCWWDPPQSCHPQI